VADESREIIDPFCASNGDGLVAHNFWEGNRVIVASTAPMSALPKRPSVRFWGRAASLSVSSNCNEVLSRVPGSSPLGFRARDHREVVDAAILESCHSTWILDREEKQSCRMLKGMEVIDRPVTTEWRPYWDLHLDPRTETSIVYLNTAHARQVRSWESRARLRSMWRPRNRRAFARRHPSRRPFVIHYPEFQDIHGLLLCHCTGSRLA
jgi:hypothetical protein